MTTFENFLTVLGQGSRIFKGGITPTIGGLDKPLVSLHIYEERLAKQWASYVHEYGHLPPGHITPAISRLGQIPHGRFSSFRAEPRTFSLLAVVRTSVHCDLFFICASLTSSMVTCEIKLFPNYFRGLSQLMNIFRHVQCRRNDFEIISELRQRLN